ncbi:MAG: hypothetical protein ABI612_06370 [Betaproteobacteria bacterium]
MYTTRITATLFAAASSFIAFASANAAPLTWQFHDVQFTDGATASGYFEYEPQGNFLLDKFEIRVSKGTLPGAVYTSSNATGTSEVICDYPDADGGCGGPHQQVSFYKDNSAAPSIYLLLDALPRSGGAIDLGNGASDQFLRRLITGGSIEADTRATFWTLARVTLADGAEATGYFQFDHSAGDQTGATFDVKVSEGNLPGYEFTPSNSALTFNNENGISFYSAALNRSLNITYVNPMTSTGASVLAGDSQASYETFGNLITQGTLVGIPSSLAAVPEPSSLVCLGFGTALLLGLSACSKGRVASAPTE